MGTEIILVDGQQRITIILLILSALKHLLEIKKNKTEEYNKVFYRLESILDTKDRIKLKRLNDGIIIKKIINNDPLNVECKIHT